MIISDALFAEFNRQFNQELTNHDVYYQLVSCCGDTVWSGFEKFFDAARKEELEHAEAFRSFLVDRLRKPKINNRPAQDFTCLDPMEMVTKALEAEQANTRMILALYELCHKENDPDAKIFLMPYVTEQRNAERELSDLQKELSRCGSNAAILIINERLAK